MPHGAEWLAAFAVLAFGVLFLLGRHARSRNLMAMAEQWDRDHRSPTDVQSREDNGS